MKKIIFLTMLGCGVFLENSISSTMFGPDSMEVSITQLKNQYNLWKQENEKSQKTLKDIEQTLEIALSDQRITSFKKYFNEFVDLAQQEKVELDSLKQSPSTGTDFFLPSHYDDSQCQRIKKLNEIASKKQEAFILINYYRRELTKTLAPDEVKKFENALETKASLKIEAQTLIKKIENKIDEIKNSSAKPLYLEETNSVRVLKLQEFVICLKSFK